MENIQLKRNQSKAKIEHHENLFTFFPHTTETIQHLFKYPEQNPPMCTLLTNGTLPQLHIEFPIQEPAGISFTNDPDTLNLYPYRNSGQVHISFQSALTKQDLDSVPLALSLSGWEQTPNERTVSRILLNNYLEQIQSEACLHLNNFHATVPLSDFSSTGLAWIPHLNSEIIQPLPWNQVSDVRIELVTALPHPISLTITSVSITHDVSQPKAPPTTHFRAPPTNPLSIHKGSQNIAPYFFDGALYNLDTQSDCTLVNSNSAGMHLIEVSLQHTPYTSVNIVLPETLDLTVSNCANAAIGFWVASENHLDSVHFGLCSDDSEYEGVVTSVPIGPYVTTGNVWNYVSIPLSSFNTIGKAWLPRSRRPKQLPITWDSITHIRISFLPLVPTPSSQDTLKLYLYDLRITPFVPEEQNSINSNPVKRGENQPLVLHTFKTIHNEGFDEWELESGPLSNASLSQKNIVTSEQCYRQVLWLSYENNDWINLCYKYRTHNAPSSIRDWRAYTAIEITIYSEVFHTLFSIDINDSGNEQFTHSIDCLKGWNTLTIPFSTFSKLTEYQPPDALSNNILDLDSVIALTIKPALLGSEGNFGITSIMLVDTETTEACIHSANEIPHHSVALTECLNTTPCTLSPMIFGINTVHYDYELYTSQGIAQVGAITHTSVRFPGGLLADSTHWESSLLKTTPEIGSDLFIDWCNSNSTDSVFTVNFGSGTALEAADWVSYVYNTLGAQVKRWEIGNELYGPWHEYHCSADSYGKRAAAYSTLMKERAPEIKIGVVWSLDRDWNSKVYEHTHHNTDAVIIHHYPLHNQHVTPMALVNAADSYKVVLKNTRSQISELYGAQKHPEIWLTEWNAVDYNPGPELYTIAHALFVARTLIILTLEKVDIAHYWAVFDPISPNKGDYGYLTSSEVLEGAHIPRPSYWAYHMIRTALHEDLQGQTTIVPILSDTPCIEAYKVESHLDWRIILINKHETNSHCAIIPFIHNRKKIYAIKLEKSATTLKHTSASIKPTISEIQLTENSLELPSFSLTILQETITTQQEIYL